MFNSNNHNTINNSSSNPKVKNWKFTFNTEAKYSKFQADTGIAASFEKIDPAIQVEGKLVVPAVTKTRVH